MTKQEFEQRMSHYRKGTYIKLVWQNIKGSYTKLTQGLVRITNKNVLVNKEGVEYVSLRVTKNSHNKANVTYFHEGVEITKQEYEQALGTQKSITDYFSKHLCDLVRFG